MENILENESTGEIMITYTISSNFCKKRLAASICPGFCYWRFFFIPLQQKNEIKGEIP